MEKYNVTGMSCAACQARVEKAVLSVPGVKECAVSLLTNTMGVEGSAPSSEIVRAVENAGYGASLKSANVGLHSTGQEGLQDGLASYPNYDNELKDTETPKIKARLIISLVLLVPLLYVSMGHMLWSWPLPPFLDNNHVGMGLYELVLSALIMVINQKFFISGFKGLLHKAPNMDTLVALGSAASFGYSLYALFAMSFYQAKGDKEAVMAFMNEFYFESAAMILTLITVGKLLESISKGRTTDALKSLMKLAPKTAIVLKGDLEEQVPIEQVKTGDLFVVKPGDNIPVDGIVEQGSGAINESALTGESVPVDKAVGDTVSAATTNVNGHLVCRATRVGTDTTLSQIIQMVSDAAATKAPIAKIADKVSGVFVPVVIAIAFLTFIIWMFVGKDVGFSLARAISVLVISCPCALGLATPVAIMVGNGMGAKSGILFKTASSLEETGKLQIVALDKTGTITKGEPKVINIIPYDGVSKKELVDTAYALEKKSEHPLAKAVVDYYEKTYTGENDNDSATSVKSSSFLPLTITDFKALAGNGLCANLDGTSIYGGNLELIKSKVKLNSDIVKKAEKLSEQGETPLFFSKGDRFLGIISVADVIKEDSPEAIRQLHNMGIQVVMLTGDNEKTARAIAKQVGADEVIAGVKPDGKEAVIKRLQKHGKVAMVGDGINDAPALTRADIGIAIGAGTDVAIDSGDIVLMKSRLLDVPSAIRLSRATLRNIHENLFWAFFYNIIGIPLAAGAYIHAFGLTLNPMFGAAAMSLSSFCVVTNALRLGFFKVNDPSRDKHFKNTISIKEENKTMEITVNGMMCPHCEAHVKEALEKISGIEEATANHEQNLVTLKTSSDVAEADIKAAVEAAGYEFAGVR